MQPTVKLEPTNKAQPGELPPDSPVHAISRRVLCVFPRYTKSFGTFDNAYPLLGVKAFMPPQGLLLIAAYIPKHWEVRFVDENVGPAKDRDFRWADAVLVSGMHIQRKQINDINRRAHTWGKVTVLGGPSVSGCPEYYPEFDYLHLGELGDATDALLTALAASTARPATQVRLTTADRLPMSRFPTPAYKLAGMSQYFLANVQFSSGCPYRCEFCDIPELYGQNPRLKTPQQLLIELDAIVESGCVGAVYFVDDNFVGNRKAAKELLPYLIEWQKRKHYPVEFACEATLNIIRSPDLLEMMREASFWTVFCGIETPDAAALKAMAKDQNNEMPILEAVRTLNSYGMEVVSGMIMGLDTDTYETPDRIVEFVEASNIPVLTINLLQALPRTPLHRRLQAEGRLIEQEGRESNVDFKLPYEDVVSMWRRTWQTVFSPEAIYRRFAYNQKHTYPHRIEIPATGKLSLRNLWKGISTLVKLMVTVGITADYRAIFWRMAWPALKSGDIETVIHVGLVAHHMISFSREADAGMQNASFFSPKLEQTA
jgi:hopanoid C-2 methylase